MAKRKVNRKLAKSGIFWMRVVGTLEILWGIGQIGLALLLGAVLPQLGSHAGRMEPAEGVGLMALSGLLVLFTIPLLVVGTGTILVKRWARTSALVLAWIVVLQMSIGILLNVAVSAFMPLGVLGSIGFSGLSLLFTIPFLMPPLFVIYFYSSVRVRAALDMKNPGSESMPIPLAFGILWLLGGILSIYAGAAFKFPILFFGVFVSELGLLVFTMVISCLYGYLCWGFYNRQALAWKIAVVQSVILSVSAIVSIIAVTPEDLMAKLFGHGLHPSWANAIVAGEWVGVVSTVVFIGFLLFLKRYFPLKRKKTRKRSKDFDIATVSG